MNVLYDRWSAVREIEGPRMTRYRMDGRSSHKKICVENLLVTEEEKSFDVMEDD